MAKRLSKKEYAKKKQAEMKETISDAMDKVSGYMQDADNLVEYLDFMSNMYDYSPRNQMLLQTQYDGAFGVAGKRQFESMGFNVREEEKPLKVLAPVFKKYTIDENKKWIPLDRPNKEQKEKIEYGEYQVRQKLSYYKFADVYDIGQTDAMPEDYPKMFPNRPFTFDEKEINEKYPDLKKSIKNFAENKGFNVIDEKTTESLGNAKGAYYPFTNDIRMRPYLSNGEYISTLNHEVAHGLLHRNSNLDTPTKEVEAEMTAYVTNKHFGLDTSEKAIGYMASWTKNLKTLEEKEQIKVMERVSKASRTMIAGIEEEYGKQEELSQKAEKEYAEPKENNIDHLKLGDMSFDYGQVKDEKIKDFPLLELSQSLDVVFEDGKSLSLYNNEEERKEFNKYEMKEMNSLNRNKNVSVDKLDISMNDYMNYALDKVNGNENSIEKHIREDDFQQTKKNKNKQKNIEL